MTLSGKESRVVVPRALLEVFEADPQKFIKLAWPGLWPVPLEFLRNREFVDGLIKEFPEGNVYLNIEVGM